MKPSHILFYGFVWVLVGGIIQALVLHDVTWIGISMILFIQSLAEQAREAT